MSNPSAGLDSPSPATANLWLLLILFCAFWLHLGSPPLFDLDEGAFSEATRDMLARGDYIATYLYGEPRYDKPILIYWLQAASVSLFGLNEFALRLPSALAASLWITVVYFFTAWLYDRRTALVSALVGATAVEVSVIGRAAIADALLNLNITVTMLSLFLYYRSGSRNWIIPAYVGMGLGMLTKGPVAVVIPFVASLLFFLLRKRGYDWLRAVLDARGWIIFLVIVLPWYTAITLKEGPGFLTGFLLEHNLGRFQAPMEGHRGEWWFYIPVLLIGLMPFTALLIRAVIDGKVWLRDEFGLFALCWFGCVFVLLTFAGTKLPHYILYGATPLFILMAAASEKVGRRGLFLTGALLFAALLALPWIVEGLLPSIKDKFILEAVVDGMELAFAPPWKIFFAFAFVVTIAIALVNRIPRLPGMTAMGLLASLATSLFILPAAGNIQQRPIKEAALIARGMGEPVSLWALNRPSFNVYSNGLGVRSPPDPGGLVLTRINRVHELSVGHLIYRSGGIVLLRTSPEAGQ